MSTPVWGFREETTTVSPRTRVHEVLRRAVTREHLARLVAVERRRGLQQEHLELLNVHLRGECGVRSRGWGGDACGTCGQSLVGPPTHREQRLPGDTRNPASHTLHDCPPPSTTLAPANPYLRRVDAEVEQHRQHVAHRRPVHERAAVRPALERKAIKQQRLQLRAWGESRVSGCATTAMMMRATLSASLRPAMSACAHTAQCKPSPILPLTTTRRLQVTRALSLSR